MIETKTAAASQLSAIATSGRLYAIVDACGNPSVQARAEASKGQCICLAESHVREQAPDAVPFLFRMDASLIEWIQGFWTEPWGVFVASDVDPFTLYTHLASFLTVELPGAKKRAFRFYDPRILKPFLQSSSADRVRTFFGPIRGFGLAAGGQVEFLVENKLATAKANSALTNPSGLFPISAAQVARLQQAADENMRGYIVQHLKAEQPALIGDLAEDAVAQQVDSAIAKARSYQLMERGAVTSFVTLAFEAGHNFDQHPRVRHYLTDLSQPGKVRMQLLLTRLSDEDWTEVRRAAGKGK